jgi:hypothetical protein
MGYARRTPVLAFGRRAFAANEYFPAKARSLVRSLSNRDAALIALTVLAAGAPLFWDLFRGSARRLLSFCAADTFYYLTVARHTVDAHIISFDGEHPTNGFHPLWQALTVLITAIVHVVHLDETWILGLTLGLGALFMTATPVLLGLALRQGRDGLSPVFLLLPLGGASLLQMPLMLWGWKSIGRPSTTLWGVVNGMETSLVVLAYAACALAYVSTLRTVRGAVLLGLSFAALALARLDHAVFSFALAGTLFVREPRNWRLALVASGLLLLVLTGYLALNQWWFGMALPISGVLKSTFPWVTPTNETLFRVLFSNPRKLPSTHAHRGLQLLIPAAVSAVTLVVLAVRETSRCARRTRDSALDPVSWLLVGTDVGVLGLFLYDFLFVPRLSQGHWYFPVSNLSVSIALVVAASALVRASGIRPSRLLFSTASLLLFAMTVASYGAVGTADVSGNATARFFFDEAPLIKRFYRGKAVRMLEFDDGIVTFATGIPAMSGMGLALDKEAVEASGGIDAFRAGRERLLDLAIKRHYDRFTVLLYPRGAVGPKSSSAEIRRAYTNQIGNQAACCTLSVEYASTDRIFSIIRANCPKDTDGQISVTHGFDCRSTEAQRKNPGPSLPSTSAAPSAVRWP